MGYLVYWYGSTDRQSCCSFILSPAELMDYSDGVQAGYHQLSTALEKKMVALNACTTSTTRTIVKLTRQERAAVCTIRQMNKDLKKEPHDRWRTMRIGGDDVSDTTAEGAIDTNTKGQSTICAGIMSERDELGRQHLSVERTSNGDTGSARLSKFSRAPSERRGSDRRREDAPTVTPVGLRSTGVHKRKGAANESQSGRAEQQKTRRESSESTQSPQASSNASGASLDRDTVATQQLRINITSDSNTKGQSTIRAGIMSERDEVGRQHLSVERTSNGDTGSARLSKSSRAPSERRGCDRRREDASTVTPVGMWSTGAHKRKGAPKENQSGRAEQLKTRRVSSESTQSPQASSNASGASLDRDTVATQPLRINITSEALVQRQDESENGSDTFRGASEDTKEIMASDVEEGAASNEPAPAMADFPSSIAKLVSMVLRSDRHQDVEAALKKLRDEALASQSQKRLVMALGGIMAANEAMASFPGSATVQQLCCHLLLLLSQHDDHALKKAVADAGGIELTISAMKRHTQRAPVVSAACALLAELSLSAELREQIAHASDVFQSIVGVMEHHVQVQSLQVSFCKLLELLANFDSQAEEACLGAGGRGAILNAIEKHRVRGERSEVDKICGPILGSFLY